MSFDCDYNNIQDEWGWVKEMVFQMLWGDFITGDPLNHHLRYIERLSKKSKSGDFSNFACNEINNLQA
jgi:hypothetical protein